MNAIPIEARQPGYTRPTGFPPTGRQGVIYTAQSMNAAWCYALGTRGRSLPIEGPRFVIRAESLRAAIKHVRARHISRAWSLFQIHPAWRD